MVSRTAVWKAIEQIKKEGYHIEAVRNRGYLLVMEDVDVYNKAEIDACMNTTYIGRNTFFYQSIGSTNTEAKRMADEGCGEGTLLVADRQTAGKGRRGRSWESPAGQNVYYTLVLKPDINPDRAPMLTLIMALAVAEGMAAICPEKKDMIKIKWPNDVVISGKKVCGILTEMSVEQDYIQHIVIGVGINVKKQTYDESIADRAISMDEALGITTSRSKLIGYIMESFEKHYNDFLKSDSLKTLKDDYETLLVNKDREVRVLDPKGEYNGIALGINDEGELLVKCESGEVVNVYAGEVSVRGVYGYV